MRDGQIERLSAAIVSAARRNGGHVWCVKLGLFVLILCSGGCNNSRYGVNYDRRYPELRRIAVLPTVIEMYSRHAGGALERRRDMEPELTEKTLANIEGFLRKRGYETIALPLPAIGEEQAKRLALLAAVRDAILTHHYVFGEARIFDYQTGDAPQVLSDANADALLCVYLKGIVPTTGRKLLKGTAVVVSLITGYGIDVSTNEAVIRLMLVDAQDGQVLWFDVHSAQTHVGGKRRLRDFVKKGCAYLLKPRK